MKEHKHPYIHCSAIRNRQDLEAAQVPTSRRVDKKAVVCLHNGILLGCKKEDILPFVTAWMDLEGITLSERSQPEKDKCHGFTYMWNLMSNTNKQTRNRLICRE